MTELMITSSVLILIVVALRHFLKGKISLRLQYALWTLVLVRLLVPVTLYESPISVMNAVQAAINANEAQTVAPMTTAPSALGDMENALPTDVTVEVGPATITNVHHYVFDWGRLAKWVWYVGIGVVGLCLLLSNLSFGRKLRKTRKKFPADGCKLPVYMVETLPSPCLFGLFRPAIYITPDVAGNETRLCHVLAHELTHYRHGDHIWSALRAVCLAVHWYNPLVWLAAMLSRRDAELACDESTIKRVGEANRMEYGRTLIGLTCEKRNVMDLLSTATTMTDGKKGIKERIALIAKKPKMLVPALIAVLLVVLVAVGCTFTGAKTENDEIVSLTAEELEQYNKDFEPLLYDEQGNATINPLSHFLTSYYDQPEGINLAEFLRYFSPSEDVTDEAEFADLKAAENWLFGADVTLDGMPVPIHKFTAGSVSEALKEYMGITLDDLSGVGMDELIYLKEYDAYYKFTSDFAAGAFVCVRGETQGDTVRLFGETATLTLKMQGDDFLIVSHQRTGDASSKSSDQAQDIALIGPNGEKCPLRLGMSVDEATEKLEAANIDLKGDYSDQLFSEDYSLWFTESYDEAGKEEWVLSSISVKTPVIETAEGLKNGDAEDKIEQIYGPCEFVERHKTEGHKYYHYEMENYLLGISSGSGGKFSNPDDPYYVFSWRISSRAQSNSYFPREADIRAIGQVPAVYMREEEMGHTAVREVAELLMTQLLDDLKTGQDGRIFIITDWKNLSASADRMYDAWMVTGEVEVRYEGILSPVGDSDTVPEGEYVSVSLGERYLRNEDGVYTLSLSPGEQQAVLEPPLLTPDMNVGIGVISDYIDDERVIYHGYFGLYVYDLKAEKITFAADLEKAVGTTIIQGSEGAAVRVSADGNIIQLYFYPEQGEPKMAYTIDSRTGNYDYGEYAPLDAYDTSAADLYDRFSHGTLGELTYTDGKNSWLLFSDWDWAE